MDLNLFETDEPLRIDYSYSLTDIGADVQCNFQAKINQKKHMFVMQFENKELKNVICTTVDLVPIEGVEIFDKKADEAR